MDKKINNNGYGYVDLGLPSGTLWATCNVGAKKPTQYGLYFQWGDTQGYTKEQVGKEKQFTWKDYKFSIDGSNSNFSKYTTGNARLELDDDAAHIHMGGEWHMPTSEQIQELIDNTTSTWTMQDGKPGRLFTSKKDESKSIFIPAVGYARYGSVRYSGDYGYVWSSMLNTVNVDYGQYLVFSSGGANLSYGYDRYGGFPVRGVIDGTSAKNATVEMLDLVNILKDVPEGAKLWSPICGECFFKAIRGKSSTPIVCKTMSVNGNNHTICFTKEGKRSIDYANGECVLFPAKDNLDWSTLRPSKTHKQFEHFQKVLVKDWCDKKWYACFYSHYDDSQDKHCLVGFSLADDEDIIPYDGNEDKIGKTIE